MNAESAPIILEISEGIATITLNRPLVLNALDKTMADALLDAFAGLINENTARVIVIQGSGEGFMAGGDIGYFHRKITEISDRNQLRRDVSAMIDTVQRLTLIIQNIPKPVIASVHGACAGFGLSLVLACDLAIVADNAKFTLAYIHLATTPDGGASYNLPRLVGRKRAAEIALLGDRFGSAEAERWGMVNRVVPLSELKNTTEKMAARLAVGPALAYARTKALLNASEGNDLNQQLEAEKTSFADSALTQDFAAGVSAFVEKRPPGFQGR